jgi:hypothetical protein
VGLPPSLNQQSVGDLTCIEFTDSGQRITPAAVPDMGFDRRAAHCRIEERIACERPGNPADLASISSVVRAPPAVFSMISCPQDLKQKGAPGGKTGHVHKPDVDEKRCRARIDLVAVAEIRCVMAQ